MPRTGVTAMVNNYIPLNAQELEAARAAADRLADAANGDDVHKFFIYDTQNEDPIELPAGAVAVLRDLLVFMSRGHGITMFPRLAEVTTVEAADILNVSRPYVIKLLEAGEMAYRMVGSHRRIPLRDVFSYKDRIDQAREAILDQMVAEAENMGLYD